MAPRLGPVVAEHRDALESIVRATGVFSADEVKVALELFDDTFGESALGNRKSSDDDSRLPSCDYEFVGAFEGEALVGYACFGATPCTDNTYDLYWIAVHPEAQRTGAGSVLMAEVEERLNARGARLIVVETSSRGDYAPTRRFYERRGYQQSALIENFYSRGDHRVILTKSLSA